MHFVILSLIILVMLSDVKPKHLAISLFGRLTDARITSNGSIPITMHSGRNTPSEIL